MPLFIVKNDITKMRVDAIVNAADKALLGGGGVDGAIHKAAGKALMAECRALGGCETGMAKITKGYNLLCKYVIHTVGPVWKGGNFGEAGLLEACYLNSLKLAEDYDCKTVAFPIISSGVFGYPQNAAFYIAENSIRTYLKSSDITVYLVIFDENFSFFSDGLISDINKYIEENVCVDEEDLCEYRAKFEKQLFSGREYSCQRICSAFDLEKEFEELDESFSEMLLRLIDEKGITDVECYKKANVDRKVFSKIRNVKKYRPRKTTAVAFAIALELSFEQAKRLIELAGYSLTHNNKFDIIIEYFIKAGEYDVYEINEILFKFDQKLLGC